MTRLTDEQIREVFAEKMEPRFAPWHAYGDRTSEAVVAFAHRIAALAVQEVERELTASCQHRDALAGRIGTLSGQLAEARTERDDWRTTAMVTRDERDDARAQLATAKREERIEGFKDGWHDAIERAMDMGLVDLGSFPITGRRKRERTKGEEWAIAGLGANEAASKRYPATPSGAAKWDISEPRNPATPSPEAREVPKSRRFIVVDHHGNVIGYLPIGDTEARLIMDMAKVRP
jgi:hypothetical protein